MSELGPAIAEAWNQVRELPLIFWLFSVFITLLASAYFVWKFDAVFLRSRAAIKLFPVLWLSFEMFAVFANTDSNLFLHTGLGLFILYGILVFLVNLESPRG